MDTEIAVRVTLSSILVFMVCAVIGAIFRGL